MAAAMKTFSPDKLKLLVEEEKIPDNLHSCNLSVRVVRDIINYIENAEFTMSRKLPAVLTCIDPRLKDRLQLTCFQIKRQMLTYSKRAEKDEAVWDMILPCLQIKDKEYVGETCNKHGINRSVLDGNASLSTIPVLTNRIVLELRAFRVATGSTWETFSKWFQNLGEKQVYSASLRKSVETLHDRRAELGRSKLLIHNGNVYRDVEQLLEERYVCPRRCPKAKTPQVTQKRPSNSKKVVKRLLRKTQAEKRMLQAELAEGKVSAKIAKNELKNNDS